MTVLVLVIVSFDKPVYYDMLEVWKKRIKDRTNTDRCMTDVWFIQCKPDSEWVGDIVNDLNELCPIKNLSKHSLQSHSLQSHSLQSHSLTHRFEVDILNKTLYVRGDECLIPGILYKTVEALSFFLSVDSSYSYIWRTNLSSVLDFAGLEKYLGTISSTTSLYSGYVGKILINHDDHNAYIEGGWKHPIRCLASSDAQNDVKQHSSPTFFASGAGFLMSRDVALYLVENKQFLRWDLIDDVAIGALLEPKFGIVPLERCWVQSGTEDISALVSSGIFHFRCESYQHLRTVEFMRYVDESL